MNDPMVETMRTFDCAVFAVRAGSTRTSMSPHSIVMGQRPVIQFSRRLKEARESLGLSQTELAEKVGLRLDAESRHERLQEDGTGLPQTGQLIKYAEALGVSTDWLLGLSDVETRFSADEKVPAQVQAWMLTAVADGRFDSLRVTSPEKGGVECAIRGIGEALSDLKAALEAGKYGSSEAVLLGFGAQIAQLVKGASL